jgi:hypothetical protein
LCLRPIDGPDGLAHSHRAFERGQRLLGSQVPVEDLDALAYCVANFTGK